MTFVDPRWPVDRILDAFDRATLVIAEAMHGAIIADTLRIPWIPVVASPAIDPFKWRDWTASLDLPYRPWQLPASSAIEYLGHRRLRQSVFCECPPSSGDPGAIAPDEVAAWLAFFHRRLTVEPTIPSAEAGTGLLRRIAKHGVAALDPVFIDRAAGALREAARQTPFLSSNEIFDDRVGRLRHAVDVFVTGVLEYDRQR